MGLPTHDVSLVIYNSLTNESDHISMTITKMNRKIDLKQEENEMSACIKKHYFTLLCMSLLLMEKI